MKDVFQEFENQISGLTLPALSQAQSGAPIKNAEERRMDWLKQRWGRLTASEFHRLMGYEDKPEFPKGAQTYARQKAVEVLTECKPDAYISPAMQWGIEHEHEALDAFIAQTGAEVTHGKNEQEFLELGDSVGGTPDGRIPSLNSGIEIKCPNSDTHLTYLERVTDGMSLKKEAPEYYWQCQGLMLITGAETWFFVSYDPRFLFEDLRLHVATIERDEADIAKLQARLDQAIEFRDKIVSARGGNPSNPQNVFRRTVAAIVQDNLTIKQQIATLMRRILNLENGLKPVQPAKLEPKAISEQANNLLAQVAESLSKPIEKQSEIQEETHEIKSDMQQIPMDNAAIAAIPTVREWLRFIGKKKYGEELDELSEQIRADRKMTDEQVAYLMDRINEKREMLLS
jgi:ribosomal protein S15P/S13E